MITPFHTEVLMFVKNHLDIKSEVVLNDIIKSFNWENKSQNMASVGFPIDNIFTIHIKLDDTKLGFVRRLSHEMVHVKQIESNRLSAFGNDIRFDNKVYSNADYKDMYDELPFEIEAFEMEREIANAYWNKTNFSG